ncbi:MAG: hypothetical protein QXD04_07240 [Candidatus Bathyarchaeia archaeon]
MPITPVDLGDIAIRGKKLVWKSGTTGSEGTVDISFPELAAIDQVLALGFKSGTDCCVQGISISGRTVTVTVKTVAGTPVAVNGATVHILAVGTPS